MQEFSVGVMGPHGDTCNVQRHVWLSLQRAVSAASVQRPRTRLNTTPCTGQQRIAQNMPTVLRLGNPELMAGNSSHRSEEKRGWNRSEKGTGHAGAREEASKGEGKQRTALKGRQRKGSGAAESQVK